MKPALLVIDMQKAYCRDESGASMKAATPYINGAIEHFRKSKLPVVWIQHKEAGVAPGSEGFDMIDALVPTDDERVFVKEYGNAFNKTELAPYLKSMGVDAVIVTGYCAEYCVLSTTRGAEDHDIAPIILHGAVASGNPENVAFVERVNDFIGYGALAKFLEPFRA